MGRLYRNSVALVMGEAFWGFQAQLIAPATFLTIVLREYGAGKIMIGSISAIETGGVMLTQILGLFFFISLARRKQQLVKWHIFVAIPFLFLMGGVAWMGPLWPPLLVRSLILLTFAMFIALLGSVIAIWCEWLADLFEVQYRGRIMGLSFGVSAVTGCCGALLTGWLLDQGYGPRLYALLIWGASVIAIVSMVIFNMIKDSAAEKSEVIIKPTFNDILKRFKASLEDHNFRIYIAGRILSMLGFCIIPFIALYYGTVQGGHLSPSRLISCGAAMTVGFALSNFILGYLGDRYGHKMGIMGGVLAQIASVFIILTTPGVYGCMLAYFFAGACTASGWVSHTNLLFETCPHRHLGAHITVANLMIGVGGAVGPLLAGVIAEWLGLRPMFIIALAFSLVALVWQYNYLREPRRQRPLATPGNDSHV